MPTAKTSPAQNRTIAGFPQPFIVALAALGLVLTIAVIPAPFTVDDNNYLVNVLALRQGRVTVANTAGLTPSRELLFFDPSPWSRDVTATPIASTAPPLYAPVALPFSLFKWRGLVALNMLAYLVTTAIAFVYARRYSSAAITPWIAAAAFAIGGFAIEYTLGVWPHSLSIALVMAAVYLAGRAIDTGRPTHAAFAGFLLAVAAGVRYQNAALLAVTAGAIFLLSRKRWRLSIAFALCAALPLLASAAFNQARHGSWNPISKGPGYLTASAIDGSGSSPIDPLVMLWAQVVDYTVRPPLEDERSRSWVSHDDFTGAHLMLGIVQKKSLLQSAPWIAVALLAMLGAWKPGGAAPDERRTQLRLMSLVAAAMLAVFSLAGPTRHDGLAFNQRYLLELLPLFAVAFAWSIDTHAQPTRRAILAAIFSAAIVLLVLLATPVEGGSGVPLWVVRHLGVSKIPLVFAGLLVIGWGFPRSRLARAVPLSVAAGLCFGWAATLHVADDVVASNLLRGHNYGRLELFSRVLPERSALVVYWANKDAAVPLLFDRDIVILDAGSDAGEDAPGLVRELLDARRRVFLVPAGFSPAVIEKIRSGLQADRVPETELEILELRPGVP